MAGPRNLVRLTLPSHYAWHKLLMLYNDSHCLEPNEQANLKTGVMEGLVELSRPFWYRIEPVGPDLELSLTAPDGAKPPTKKDSEAARVWATRRYWLSVDMEAVRSALEADFFMFSLAGRFWPLVSPAYSSYWNALLRIYCGRKVEGILRQNLGSKVRFGGKTYALLPSAQQMLPISGLELQAMGLSRWSGHKLPHITQQYLSNPDLQLQNLPPDAQKAVARIHRGFELGSTSAAWVMMRGAIHPDVALEGSHIRRALAEGLGLEQTPKVREYNQLMAVYAPYRSFAAYYIHLSQMARWRKRWKLEAE